MEIEFTDGLDKWGAKVSPNDHVYVTDQIRYPDGELSTKDFSIKKVKVSKLTSEQKERMLHQNRRDAGLAIRRHVKKMNAREYSRGWGESAGYRLDRALSLVEGYMKEGHLQMEMKNPEAVEELSGDELMASMCEAAIDCMNANTPRSMSRKMIAEMAANYMREKHCNRM
tara:strand:+ start:1848 stop:2357 length:510 start_codon:yes stop_codon:yes gene_type:complete